MLKNVYVLWVREYAGEKADFVGIYMTEQSGSADAGYYRSIGYKFVELRPTVVRE